ncbi:hypothetical protein [Nocardia vermiculata]|uniref:Uncharacterized protein n=1 Tax=Nocardia vermiculata TaxID=257274 RepID=A0A846XSX2_9NOCA|nr:hypothetical protein [Nocardia vermiculata]NKY50176.1 hypothetical protein [Nocardia vermiculata]
MAGPDTAQPGERDRQMRALRLRMAGAPWAAIAEELGYADPSGPFRAVESLLNRQESEAAETYRQMEDMRLDVALRKVWPGVMTGDLKAIETMLKVHDRRSKLHGLAAPAKVMVQNVGLGREEFLTTVQEDIRALGIDPGMDTPLAADDGTWANT